MTRISPLHPLLDGVIFPSFHPITRDTVILQGENPNGARGALHADLIPRPSSIYPYYSKQGRLCFTVLCNLPLPCDITEPQGASSRSGKSILVLVSREILNQRNRQLLSAQAL